MEMSTETGTAISSARKKTTKTTLKQIANTKQKTVRIKDYNRDKK